MYVRQPLTMTVADTLLPLSVSVSHAVLTMGCDKDIASLPVVSGVTWKRITWAASVGNAPCHVTALAVGL